MTMTRLAFPDDRAVGNIQCREQSRRAMPEIVMGDAFDVTQSHRENGLRTFQGLNLAFLVDTQNQRLIRGIKVQTNDIANFFDEERIGRKLERAAPVGLDTKQGKVALDRAFRQFGFARE